MKRTRRVNCGTCGRFCRRVRDDFAGDYWRCRSAYFDAYAGQWEHE